MSGRVAREKEGVLLLPAAKPLPERRRKELYIKKGRGTKREVGNWGEGGIVREGGW